MLPTSDNVQDLLDSMKIKSRITIFREFLRDNPESVTAKMELLGTLQKTSAPRSTIELTKQRLNGQRNDQNADVRLNATVDSEIWGEFVALANSAFPQIVLRPTLLGRSSNLFRTQDINGSELLQQFAMRHIGPVEEALQNRPHSSELWELWGIFAPHAPNRSLPSFLATLTPVPDLPGFPPVSLYPDLIRNYQSTESWKQIVDLVEPIWESYQKMIDANENIKHRLTKQLLEQYINPLCDAYEKTGQDQKAEKIRNAWKRAEGWR
jgi:hypothetical protein